jgi:hypothetical protein
VIADLTCRCRCDQVPSSADASGWKCLGMYALPGEPVTVTVPQALADSNGAKLLVGGWSDTLYHLEQWARVPKAQRRFAVTDVDTVIGSALGGLIYIILPDDWPAVAVTVTGEGQGRVAATSSPEILHTCSQALFHGCLLACVCVWATTHGVGRPCWLWCVERWQPAGLNLTAGLLQTKHKQCETRPVPLVLRQAVLLLLLAACHWAV